MLLRDQSLRPAHARTGELWLHQGAKPWADGLRFSSKCGTAPTLPCCPPSFRSAVLMPVACPQFCVGVESLLRRTAVSPCGVRCPYAVSLFFLITSCRSLRPSGGRGLSNQLRASPVDPAGSRSSSTPEPTVKVFICVCSDVWFILSFVLFYFVFK